MTNPEIEARYRAFLSDQGMLYTRERATILEAVFKRQDHFSADDLLFHMRQDGMDVSRATLYRNLKLLCKADLLVEADFGHGHLHYERAAGSLHEHLVCKKCGAVTEVNTSRFAEAVQQVATQSGFKVEHHQLKIFGLCKKCQKKGS